MITLPEGFNTALLVSDLFWISLPLIGVAVLIAAFNIIKRILRVI